MPEKHRIFKEGDIIEISGKPEGIVIHADSETFMLRPFKSRGNKDAYQCWAHLH